MAKIILKDVHLLNKMVTTLFGCCATCTELSFKKIVTVRKELEKTNPGILAQTI